MEGKEMKAEFLRTSLFKGYAEEDIPAKETEKYRVETYNFD